MRMQSLIRGFLGRRRAEHHRLKLLSVSITTCTNEQLCLNRAISNYSFEVLNWFGAQNNTQLADVARQMRQLDLLTRQILRRKVSCCRVNKVPPPSSTNSTPPNQSLLHSIRAGMVARIRKLRNLPERPSQDVVEQWPLAQQKKLTQTQLYVLAVLSAFANRPDGNIDFVGLKACQSYLKPVKRDLTVTSKMPGTFPYVVPDKDLVAKIIESAPRKSSLKPAASPTRKPEAFLYSKEALLLRVAKDNLDHENSQTHEVPHKKRRKKKKKDDNFFVPVVKGVYDDDRGLLNFVKAPKFFTRGISIHLSEADYARMNAFVLGFQSQFRAISLPEPVRAQLAKLTPMQPIMQAMLAKIPQIDKLNLPAISLPSLPPSAQAHLSGLPSMSSLSPTLTKSLRALSKLFTRTKFDINDDDSEWEDEEELENTIDVTKHRIIKDTAIPIYSSQDNDMHMETGLTKGLEKVNRSKHKAIDTDENAVERLWAKLLKPHQHPVIDLVLSNVFEPIEQQDLVSTFFTGRLSPELLLHATLIRRWTKDLYSACLSTVQTFRGQNPNCKPFRSCPRCLEPFFTEKSLFAHCGTTKIRSKLEMKALWSKDLSQFQCSSDGSLCWISRKTLSPVITVMDLVLKNRFKSHGALLLFNKTPTLPLEFGLINGPKGGGSSLPSEVEASTQKQQQDTAKDAKSPKKSKKSDGDSDASPGKGRPARSPSPSSNDKKTSKRKDGDLKSPQSPSPASSSDIDSPSKNKKRKPKAAASDGAKGETNADSSPANAANDPALDDSTIKDPSAAFINLNNIESSTVLEKSINFNDESLADYSDFPVPIPKEDADPTSISKNRSKKLSQSQQPSSPDPSSKKSTKAVDKGKSPTRPNSAQDGGASDKKSVNDKTKKDKPASAKDGKRPPSGDSKKKKKA